MNKFLLLIIIFLSPVILLSQVENVPVANPVYLFLEHAEVFGYLPHFSSSSLPLQRKEIIEALKNIRKHENDLSESELSTLLKFEKEFEIQKRDNAVLFNSNSDSTQVLSDRFFSNDEKFIYHYKDSSNSISLSPLAYGEVMIKKNQRANETIHAMLGGYGVRLSGTLSNNFGYYLQASNGTLLTGSRSLALEDQKIQQNVKFSKFISDLDFSESHVTYNQDWFFASIGKETRLQGSGINEKLVISENAPPMDGIQLGAKFSNFEYRFSHYSLLSYPVTNVQEWINAELISKYLTTHRFSIRPSWGEFSFFEEVVYSGRGYDLGYLNPLSLLFSTNNSMLDRDNALMGADFTVRPFKRLQIKGTYILDDLIFSKIGTNFWSNKSAWNIAVESYFKQFTFGIEYSRVEPYTFTHANFQDNYTNDSMMIGGNLKPNSQEMSGYIKWYWGQRYPNIFRVIITNHGDNIYNAQDSLIRNVGGDPRYSKRDWDSPTVKLLDGNFKIQQIYEFSTGIELVRGFNLSGLIQFVRINTGDYIYFRIKFSYEDF